MPQPYDSSKAPLRKTTTTILEIAYYDHGADDPERWPVILTHGFPYDIHAYDAVVPLLYEKGARVIVPYVRGYGPTRFLSTETVRTGQQAALGNDLIELLDALGVAKAVVAGFDWGGLASCVVAALAPNKVDGLVSYGGYDIYNIAEQQVGYSPQLENVMWYQHLFQTERGREVLARDRKELGKILWREWSPKWTFTDEEYQRTASSFDNLDFVDVVLSCYRHAHGTVAGAPDLEKFEHVLSMKPPITVPSVTLDAGRDPLKPGGSASHEEHFTGRHELWTNEEVGHSFPQEAPGMFADAVLKVHEWVLDAR